MPSSALARAELHRTHSHIALEVRIQLHRQAYRRRQYERLEDKFHFRSPILSEFSTPAANPFDSACGCTCGSPTSAVRIFQSKDSITVTATSTAAKTGALRPMRP